LKWDNKQRKKPPVSFPLKKAANVGVKNGEGMSRLRCWGKKAQRDITAGKKGRREGRHP